MKRWLGLSLLLIAIPVWSQAPAPRERQQQAIEPLLDRPQIVIPRIESGDVEFNLFAGMLSLQSFSTRFVYGLRGAYHLSEDFFVEASLGLSTVSDRTYRRIGAPPFDDRTEDVEYYNVSIAYNIFPGELFLGSRRAYTSAVFIAGGIGNTRIADEDYFTYNVGFGLRALPTDRLSVRIDVRTHIITHDLLGERERTQNPEIVAGIGIYF